MPDPLPHPGTTSHNAAPDGPGAAPSQRRPARKRTATTRARFAARLLAFGLGLAVSLALAEAALWVAGWPIVGIYWGDNGDKGPRALRIPGPSGGAYRGFGSTVRAVHYDYDVTYAVNRHGFATPDPAPKRPGEYRVGLIGDSFTFGLGVQTSQRFADLWFDLVKSNHPHATLYNLGTPSSGTLQHAEILAGVGAEYDLDEIILCFYSGNDPDDNIAHQRLLAAGPLPDVEPQPHGVRAFLRSNFRLPSFVWIRGLRALSTVRYGGGGTVQGVRAAWPVTEQALDNFRAAVGDRPFSIWYLPSAVELNDDLWRKVKGDFQFDDAARYAVADLLRAWASARGVPFLDTTPALITKPYADVHFPVDQHWNADGHRLVADLLIASPEAAAITRRERPVP